MRAALTVVILAAACSSPVESPLARLGIDPAEVTIVRDRFGVPHVYGPTDAHVVFGLGYAQAEDDLLHVEDNFVRALGRACEVYGEETWVDDTVARALELEFLARAEYERAPARMRALYDAYSAGLNAFLDDHPARELLVLEVFEPWHTLAFLRYKYYLQEFVGYAGVAWEEIDVEAWRDPRAASARARPQRDRAEPEQGSNAWAVGPAKSADGHALLFINPHVSFYGPGLYYESHLVSEEGWNLSGVGRFGFPFPYMGHNERLGWAHTDNYHDHGDLYAEVFDHADDELLYRYGDGYRRAEQWTETVRVRTSSGLEDRPVTFRKTHHGPILLAREGRPLAIRLARLASGGWYDQHYAMGRADSLGSFRAALGQNAIPYMNVTYADADGNIYYVYNGVVPRRSVEFDWSEPVDGSDPATEWDGFHGLDELPQVLNPGAGFVLNTNSTPFTASTTDVPEREAFPAYMIGGETDNPRARVSREILTERQRFDFAQWSRAVLDTRVYAAREWCEALEAESRALARDDPERALGLGDAIAEFLAWDGVAEVDSVPMTWLVLAAEARGRLLKEDPEAARVHVRAFELALAELTETWGRLRVPWGEMNRHQRQHWAEPHAVSDDEPSLAVPGGPGNLGMAFVFTARAGEDTRARYGRHGNSYVSVVEFGPRVIARSIVFYGQSGSPRSPHYFDQAELYARREWKPAWFERDEVLANAERVYHPGQ